MTQTLGAALAAPAAFVLLLLPGLVFLSLLHESDRRRLGPDERAFLAGGVSVAVSAWVALLLAELGVFSTVGAAALECVIAFMVVAVGRFLGRKPGSAFGAIENRESVLPALLVLTVAFALQAKPSEYIVGGRDPGAYVSAMGVIARTGAITHLDPVVASIPPEDLSLFYANLDERPFHFTLDVDEDNLQASWPRFMGFELDHPTSGKVTPQFFHLFPAFGAYLYQTMGVRGALATPPIFGILGTLAAFFLARRMFGVAVAVVAALGLATSVLQVWFARYPVSEGFSQFLILSGLFAHHLDQESNHRAFGRLAGVFLGLSLLVRIDSLLLLAPIGLCVLVQALRRNDAARWSRVTSLLVPFVAILLQAGLHAVLFSKRYAHQILTRRYWSHTPATWAVAILAITAVAVLAWRVGPRLILALREHQASLRAAAVVALFILVGYAIAIRPSLSAWAGGDGNGKAEKIADPTLLRSLGFDRLAAHDAQALRRYSWFVGAPALGRALIGLALFFRRAGSLDLLTLTVILVFSGFYFYKIRVFNDYFFAMRRYVPVTLPFTFILAALALVTLARRAGGYRIAAWALGLGALGVSVGNTMAIVRFVDWKGSVRFVADVARRFGPTDIVLFEQPKSIHLLSLPLWGLYGTNALEFRRFNPDPLRLNHLLLAWRSRYRNIYLVTSFRTDVCGVFLERTQPFRFTSQEWEWTYDRVPARPEPRAVEFVLSRVVEPESLRVPNAPLIDIGGSGDSQISGFFEREATGETTYRWTGGCLDEKGNATGSVYVPAASAGARLRVRATAHLRPSSVKPARVTAYFADVPVGEFTADETWRDFEVVLPDPLPKGSKILRLDVPAWRPSNTDALASDTRDLGVMVDRIEVMARSPKS